MKRKYDQLLTIGSDAKTVKGEKEQVLTGILYLAPHKISGKNFCSHATEGCIMSCLYTAGRGKFTSTQVARIKRSRYLTEEYNNFMLDAVESIIRLKKKAFNKGFTPAVRLNGTSDLLWENMYISQELILSRKYILNNIDFMSPVTENKMTLLDLFADTQFYDYTKNPFRKTPKNLHITFSRAESNEEKVKIALDRGQNIAVVFEELPTEYMGRKVINGDLSDLRFTDPKNVIVGLLPKGDAKKDATGFVVRNNNQ